jgi:hypothetical protein
MLPSRLNLAPARRPARDLIDAILDNMRANLEPLRYSTLAPGRYLVYVHPAEYARLEGIIPILQDEAIRALAEALSRLNRRSPVQRVKDRVTGGRIPAVQNAAIDWHVEFLPDPDGDLKAGDIVIYSELLLPARPELGVGEQTRRIATERSGSRRTTREHIVTRPPKEPTSLARLIYDDDAGHHEEVIAKESVTIGRGGMAYPIDIRITSSPDVSREHARIRRDSKTGGFFLIDLSSLGTTLNGRHVPSGFEAADGIRKENGVETPLPNRARIGLTDVVYLDFQLQP